MKSVKFSGGQIKIDIEKIDAIQRACASKMRTKVGILGQKNQRDNLDFNGAENLTNAEIGYKHEYGSLSERIPPRSFLKGPLMTKGKELVEAKDQIWQAFTKTQISLKRAYRELGIIAEGIIQRAFETGGYGAWQENSEMTILIKGSDRPLIDSGQLRKSIMSKVEGE